MRGEQTDRIPYVILKFGGTSVSSHPSWETIASQARRRIADGTRPVIVCSALSGVTDLLGQLADTAAGGASDRRALDATMTDLRARHLDLAESLGMDDPAFFVPDLDAVARMAQGIALLGEAGPSVRARLLAYGEILSTRIGAEYLRRSGLRAAWIDAREILVATQEPAVSEARRFLAAAVDDDADPGLIDRLAMIEADVLVTQGFIAGDGSGGTVLLGRGGSDTSAAVLAARLRAVRCEIWTDVPGVFTANPRLVAGARLLRVLDYDEAQEIASQGSKVLHPRSIAPCRRHGIPMEIRWTSRPETEGTRIVRLGEEGDARVKAVSHKMGVTLVSMETNGMWQQVGFLADVFACFKAHGLSIDLVSTSEMNVTVTLDPNSNALAPERMRALIADLSRLCTVTVVGPCAAVSLVGRSIRTILHRLGPVLSVFEEKKIHLVSQAASDLNLTFVVDEPEAERLVRALHAHLHESAGSEPGLGRSWSDLQGETRQGEAGPGGCPWWHRRADELLGAARRETPLYVYDEETIRRACAVLRRGLASVGRIFYAVKANAFDSLLRVIAEEGMGLECVSLGEIQRVRALLPGLPLERILFTPNFAAREEYEAALSSGLLVTVDSLHPLERWGEIFARREILLRIDPGTGKGHHAHVRTAGARSKFGIQLADLDQARELAQRAGARVVGLHAHLGSGIMTPSSWGGLAEQLASLAGRLPDARVVDLGGGFGVPDRPGMPRLDFGAVEATLAAVRNAHPNLEFWIEPGRFLVAESGVLLGRVTQIKRKGEITYVGTDAGMNSLLRPALYGAHHEIVNLSRLGEDRSVVTQVVGPICESGDVMGQDRLLPPTQEGDVLLFANTGAYGAAMASRYNLREPAAEVMLREEQTA